MKLILTLELLPPLCAPEGDPPVITIQGNDVTMVPQVGECLEINNAGGLLRLQIVQRVWNIPECLPDEVHFILVVKKAEENK